VVMLSDEVIWKQSGKYNIAIQLSL
jgi:hypothetical protein